MKQIFIDVKHIIKLLPAVLLLLAVALSGCERNKNPLKNTEWKLYGFGNTTDNTLREAEPKDCNICYTISFREDGTITGHTSTNEIRGQYLIKGRKLNFMELVGTEIKEIFDGDKYVEVLHQVEQFEIISEQLKLYYGNTNYLLFKKR